MNELISELKRLYGEDDSKIFDGIIRIMRRQPSQRLSFSRVAGRLIELSPHYKFKRAVKRCL